MEVAVIGSDGEPMGPTLPIVRAPMAGMEHTFPITTDGHGTVVLLVDGAVWTAFHDGPPMALREGDTVACTWH